MKFLIFFAILAIGIFFTFLKCREDGYQNAIIGIIASIALSIVSSFLYVYMMVLKLYFPNPVTLLQWQQMKIQKITTNMSLIPLWTTKNQIWMILVIHNLIIQQNHKNQ